MAHGSGAHGFGRGFFGGRFHDFRGRDFSHWRRRDAHRDFHRHGWPGHDFGHWHAHTEGHFGHWQPGHWHVSSGFGDHAGWSWRGEGLWHR